jgi:hypothetical protein
MEETLHDLFVKSALASCRHFNGVMNKTCDAGVSYEHSDDTCPPCIPGMIKGRTPFKCDKFEIMSQAEAEKEADEREATANRGMMIRRAAHDDAKKRGLGKGHGGIGQIECPACKGKVSYSVASYKGHMHGLCSTPGCASWME